MLASNFNTTSFPPIMVDDSMEISSDHGRNGGDDDIDIDIDFTTGDADEDYILEDATSNADFGDDPIHQTSPALGHDDLMVDDEDNIWDTMSMADAENTDERMHSDTNAVPMPDESFMEMADAAPDSSLFTAIDSSPGEQGMQIESHGVSASVTFGSSGQLRAGMEANTSSNLMAESSHSSSQNHDPENDTSTGLIVDSTQDQLSNAEELHGNQIEETNSETLSSAQDAEDAHLDGSGQSTDPESANEPFNGSSAEGEIKASREDVIVPGTSQDDNKIDFNHTSPLLNQSPLFPKEDLQNEETISSGAISPVIKIGSPSTEAVLAHNTPTTVDESFSLGDLFSKDDSSADKPGSLTLKSLLVPDTPNSEELSQTPEKVRSPEDLQSGNTAFSVQSPNHVTNHNSIGENDKTTNENAANANRLITVPDMMVVWKSEEFALFSKSEDDDPETFFLSEAKILDQPLGDFLVAIRGVVGGEIEDDHELCLAVEDLGLEIEESSPMLNNYSLGQIIDIYDQLILNDHRSPQALYLTLGTRPHFARRLAHFTAGAAEGKGLSDLISFGDQTGEVHDDVELEQDLDDTAEQQLSADNSVQDGAVSIFAEQSAQEALDDSLVNPEVEAPIVDHEHSIDQDEDDLIDYSDEEAQIPASRNPTRLPRVSLDKAKNAAENTAISEKSDQPRSMSHTIEEELNGRAPQEIPTNSNNYDELHDGLTNDTTTLHKDSTELIKENLFDENTRAEHKDLLTAEASGIYESEKYGYESRDSDFEEGLAPEYEKYDEEAATGELEEDVTSEEGVLSRQHKDQGETEETTVLDEDEYHFFEEDIDLEEQPIRNSEPVEAQDEYEIDIHEHLPYSNATDKYDHTADSSATASAGEPPQDEDFDEYDNDESKITDESRTLDNTTYNATSKADEDEIDYEDEEDNQDGGLVVNQTPVAATTNGAGKRPITDVEADDATSSRSQDTKRRRP